MVTSAALLPLVAMVAQTPLTGERSIASQCQVSADASYGRAQDNPIKVGGGPMGDGPARQRRFLQALVGPGGQAVTFRRRGSMMPGRDGVIVDAYEVTYAGLETPIELFLDLYRWERPKAPQGFLCGRPIGLDAPSAPPPPDAGRTLPSTSPVPPMPGGRPPIPPWSRFVDFAIELGKTEELPPIPLDPYGSTRYGVAFDPFTTVARTQRATGAVPDEMRTSAFRSETLVIAFPLTCDGVTAKPVDISATFNGRILSRSVEQFKGETLAKRAPAYTAPDDALGVTVSGSGLLPGGQITIRYDRPACGTSGSINLTVSEHREPPAGVTPVWPQGVPAPPEGSVRVTLHALIDPHGVPIDITVADGPEPFHAAAIEALKAARFRPRTVNGVPMRSPVPMARVVTFVPPR
jgi:hypothetical protein